MVDTYSVGSIIIIIIISAALQFSDWLIPLRHSYFKGCTVNEISIITLNWSDADFLTKSRHS